MRDRDRRFELLATADSARLVELADRCLDAHEPFTLIRSPEIGAVSAQVREPVAALRFVLGDVLVCRAEVLLGGESGWSLRIGSDRAAALAAAVCDAAAELGGPLADDVDALCTETEREAAATEAREWARLSRTIVEFEDIP
jgi:alpha-D-ribose 1-methylphosphonate 5-triphosphate synthase subunit PhnG